jgi:hypothetical protein
LHVKLGEGAKSQFKKVDNRGIDKDKRSAAAPKIKPIDIREEASEENRPVIVMEGVGEVAVIVPEAKEDTKDKENSKSEEEKEEELKKAEEEVLELHLSHSTMSISTPGEYFLSNSFTPGVKYVDTPGVFSAGW